MVSNASSWFKVREIASKTWQIEDDIVYCYVIEGSEKALLVDTGWGIGDLAGVVSELTTKPLVVINTHGHIDHVCGNYLYDGIYIHRDDVPLMQASFIAQSRAPIIERFPEATLPPGFDKHAWVNARLRSINPFVAPPAFELGRRRIEVLEIPGHSPGSVCLLDEANRLLFTGDSITSGDILMQLETSLSVSTFLRSVTNLAAISGKVDYLIPSHGEAPIRPRVLRDLMDGLEKILAGTLKGVEHQSRFGRGLLARFGSCGVIYREDRL